jgi:hypothetical protein
VEETKGSAVFIAQYGQYIDPMLQCGKIYRILYFCEGFLIISTRDLRFYKGETPWNAQSVGPAALVPGQEWAL